jgi:hypothetical protein
MVERAVADTGPLVAIIRKRVKPIGNASPLSKRFVRRF